MQKLSEQDFGALEISQAVGAAAADLALDEETVIRYLVRVTSSTGTFKSDGHIVTVR